MRFSLHIAALCTAFAGALGAPAQAGQDPITFGIVPQQSASRLAKMWGPLMAELGTRLGQDVHFRTTKDIPTFEACLADGAFDIAYMNPMHYAVFSGETAYRAVARQANKRLKGVIVARKDSAVSALMDLDGTRLAFPSPGAFGASVLTRANLTNSGVRFEPAYVKSHDSVYRAVAAGLMPAGGGVLRTFNAVDPAIREQLEIIHETDAFTPHAIAVRGGVSDEMTNMIRATLMEIAQDRPELVKGVGMAGFQSSVDADWDDVRALGLAREDTGILSDGDAVCPSG